MIVMNIKEILLDSIKYPFLDWKKILILGLIYTLFIIPFSASSSNLRDGFSDQCLFIALLINFLITGYFFKIIQYSLRIQRNFLNLGSWFLFKNGFKVTCVSLIYSIPVSLPLIILNSHLFNFYSYTPGFLINIMGEILLAYLHWDAIWVSIQFFVYILYFLILFPISLMAIANMANNDGKLSYAFEFKVIFDKIKNIGWIKFYSWYLLTGIINLLIFLIGVTIGFILILIHAFPFEKLIDSLILTPYLYIFFSRSIALIYNNE